MFRKIGRKRGVAALSVIAVLALASGAYAYFTSNGSATSTGASVGTASAWTVNPGTATGGPLYPGAGTINIPYTVTNPAGGGYQNLTAVSVTVASSSGNVTQSGVAVPGCLAAWFGVVNTAPTPLPQSLAAGATSTGGSAAVTLTNAAANQNPCQGVHPDITISAS